VAKKKKQPKCDSVGLYKDIHTPYVRGYAYDIDPISGLYEPFLCEEGVLIYDEVRGPVSEVFVHDSCFWLNRYLHQITCKHIGRNYDE
jgi:hypothetical protein